MCCLWSYVKKQIEKVKQEDEILHNAGPEPFTGIIPKPPSTPRPKSPTK